MGAVRLGESPGAGAGGAGRGETPLWWRAVGSALRGAGQERLAGCRRPWVQAQGAPSAARLQLACGAGLPFL